MWYTRPWVCNWIPEGSPPGLGQGAATEGVGHTALRCTGISPRIGPGKKIGWLAREERQPGISTVLEAKRLCWGETKKTIANAGVCAKFCSVWWLL